MTDQGRASQNGMSAPKVETVSLRAQMRRQRTAQPFLAVSDKS